MIEPKVGSGARVLLFDRLVDTEPQSQKEVRPFRTLDKQGLKQSIRMELGRLLNTRCPIPLAPAAEERTVINYGIPDFSYLSPNSGDHRAKLETWVRDAIVSYEPRLVDVRVSVDPPVRTERSLVVRIEAKLQLETIREPVAFSVVMKRDTARR
ncbi:MAG TPA: type VI secretion system baseplate subunit TssE [Terriglobia bacterium]